MQVHHNQDTICAPATPHSGAIQIIRVAGNAAIQITETLFSKTLNHAPTHSLHYGKILDNHEVLDEVLVSVFRAPHSYTGEDATEISCHGSPYIVKRLLELLIEKGCRLATQGEFTQRAFINGKMDLSQAEAVADLIASESKAAHKMAYSQLRGDFSKELSLLRAKLLELSSLLELELDFSDHEDLEFADRGELAALSDKIDKQLSALIESFHLGNALKNGVPIAIIGNTNAGKSTILNAIVGEEKAIVSDIHGTTRDIVEDSVNYNGTLFRFIDTAGIRKTKSKIEQIGIQRSFQQIEKAEIVFWVMDVQSVEKDFDTLYPQLQEKLSGKSLYVLINKMDTVAKVQQSEAAILKLLMQKFDLCTQSIADYLFITAKDRTDITALKNCLNGIAAQLSTQSNMSQHFIVTNTRHYEALQHAEEAIRRVKEGLAHKLSGDFISIDLHDCIHHLSEIVGDISTIDVLSNIFSKFCIGK